MGRGRNRVKATRAPQPVNKPTIPARRGGAVELVSGSSDVGARGRIRGFVARRAGVIVSSEETEGEVECDTSSWGNTACEVYGEDWEPELSAGATIEGRMAVTIVVLRNMSVESFDTEVGPLTPPLHRERRTFGPTRAGDKHS